MGGPSSPTPPFYLQCQCEANFLVGRSKFLGGYTHSFIYSTEMCGESSRSQGLGWCRDIAIKTRPSASWMFRGQAPLPCHPHNPSSLKKGQLACRRFPTCPLGTALSQAWDPSWSPSLPPHSPPWASAPDLYGLGSAWDRPRAREPPREPGSAAMRGGGGRGGKQRCVLKSASFWPRLNFQEAGFD